MAVDCGECEHCVACQAPCLLKAFSSDHGQAMLANVVDRILTAPLRESHKRRQMRGSCLKRSNGVCAKNKLKHGARHTRAACFCVNTRHPFFLQRAWEPLLRASCASWTRDGSKGIPSAQTCNKPNSSTDSPAFAGTFLTWSALSSATRRWECVQAANGEDHEKKARSPQVSSCFSVGGSLVGSCPSLLLAILALRVTCSTCGVADMSLVASCKLDIWRRRYDECRPLGLLT